MGCHFSAICKVVALPVGDNCFRRRRAQAEAPFSAEFRDSCAAAFSLCPLMRQKWAVRYFWPARSSHGACCRSLTHTVAGGAISRQAWHSAPHRVAAGTTLFCRFRDRHLALKKTRHLSLKVTSGKGKRICRKS
jgi:hypothetical protein